MNETLALILSIFLVMILIRKVDIAYSILIGAFFLGIITEPENLVKVSVETAASSSTLNLLAVVSLALLLSFSMNVLGFMKEITCSVDSVAKKYSIILIPLLIGLIPMPGGALISAMMIKDLVKRYGIEPSKATFINYWLRHVWVSSWPLYPAIIISAAVLDKNVFDIIKTTYPIAIASFISGILVILALGIKDVNEKRAYNAPCKKPIFRFFVAFSPIIVLILTAIIWNLLSALVFSLLLTFILRKPNLDQIKAIVKSFDYTVFVLVFGIMLYKNIIVEINAAEKFLRDTSFLNVYLSSLLLSFVVGLATGIELSFGSIAMPVLINFVEEERNLFLAFLSGYIGVMVSPLHLCLVLTAKLYRANINRVYIYIIISSALTYLLSLLFAIC